MRCCVGGASGGFSCSAPPLRNYQHATARGKGLHRDEAQHDNCGAGKMQVQMRGEDGKGGSFFPSGTDGRTDHASLGCWVAPSASCPAFRRREGRSSCTDPTYGNCRSRPLRHLNLHLSPPFTPFLSPTPSPVPPKVLACRANEPQPLQFRTLGPQHPLPPVRPQSRGPRASAMHLWSPRPSKRTSTEPRSREMLPTWEPALFFAPLSSPLFENRLTLAPAV